MLVAELICEELLIALDEVSKEIKWSDYKPSLINFIRYGKYSFLEEMEEIYTEETLSIIKEHRQKYKNDDFFNNPIFDKVAITTLFTFHWNITIDTINFAKKLCKKETDVMVGGIMSTLLPDEVFAATGIRPFVGLLNQPGLIDKKDKQIIDELPLDYSILDEIDYKYPASNAYFAYMTRGCTNKCKFCAVPTLEPEYCDYVGLKSQLELTKSLFIEQRDLLLMDNNVLASDKFEQIIDEIKSCGFERGAMYKPPNEYEVTIKNLKAGYNDRAYTKKCIAIYKALIEKLKGEEQAELYTLLERSRCLYSYTATKDALLSLDDFVRPLYNKSFKKGPVKRIVDFNQGVEANLITDANMSKLSEVNIEPLRIAFDHWSMRKTYENAIRTAVRHNIKHLSNYMLYNFEDKPEELYYRMRMNVDLCEELGASIYSFPMKYHPISDRNYFKNRDYIGKHWNRKFIRAIQAVLNATKGKVGKGLTFFNEAFGTNIDEFNKILWMPEALIIYRMQYKENITREWWDKFQGLDEERLNIAKEIIGKNKFKDGEFTCNDNAILEVLAYYQITRDVAQHKTI